MGFSWGSGGGGSICFVLPPRSDAHAKSEGMTESDGSAIYSSALHPTFCATDRQFPRPVL